MKNSVEEIKSGKESSPKLPPEYPVVKPLAHPGREEIIPQPFLPEIQPIRQPEIHHGKKI
ncbi:MAG TPA: hypothetical protein VII99_03620 [Bacteroidia bacterium]